MYGSHTHYMCIEALLQAFPRAHKPIANSASRAARSPSNELARAQLLCQCVERVEALKGVDRGAGENECPLGLRNVADTRFLLATRVGLDPADYHRMLSYRAHLGAHESR